MKPEIKAMADKYGVTVPQLCIRYTIQLGTASLPKTANPKHIETIRIIKRVPERVLIKKRFTESEAFFLF